MILKKRILFLNIVSSELFWFEWLSYNIYLYNGGVHKMVRFIYITFSFLKYIKLTP